MTSLEHVPPKEVGERLRIARETANLRQADAAAAIGVARTTIVAIEQGERRVRMGELQMLTRLYGTSVNALLRREAVHADLVPRFRKLEGIRDAAVDQAAALLASLVKAESSWKTSWACSARGTIRPSGPYSWAMCARRRNRMPPTCANGWVWAMDPSPTSSLSSRWSWEYTCTCRRFDGRISGLFASKTMH